MIRHRHSIVAQRDKGELIDEIAANQGFLDDGMELGGGVIVAEDDVGGFDKTAEHDARAVIRNVD